MAARRKKGGRRDTERRKAIEAEVAREVTEILREERGEVTGEVIEIAARDTERSPAKQEILDRERSRRESFYSDLVFSLCNVRCDEPEARLLWVNLLAHKVEMSDRLGRNVGIRVAALDYFKNIVGLLDEVKIVGGAEFVETERLAVTDGLTGAFNHRYFQDRLERGLARSRELAQPLSLLMIDIDYFKQYNDLNGHIAGDVALREMAALLRRWVKREDTVARYGGEEFAVVLFNTDRRAAGKVAERLRREVEKVDFPNEQVLPGGHLTVSLGVAVFPEDCSDRAGLIARADAALYAAKRGGRNRVCGHGEEARDARRISASELGAFWHPPGDESAAARAGVVDIAPAGAVLSIAEPPEVGDVVQLTLTGDFPGRRLSLPVKVLWRNRVPGLAATVGVEFLPESEDVRLELGKLIPDRAAAKGTGRAKKPRRGAGAEEHA
jgi:diguanylate cyclase (GGDEF)-like protein